MRGNRFGRFSHVATERAADLGVEGAKETLLDEVRRNFDSFLEARPEGRPFCYWWGPTNTHRTWERGSGKELWGLDPDDLKGRLPEFLPDVEEVREDVNDYLGECQAFDAGLGVLLERLEAIGELNDTLIVVSGDHGIPGFTRAKCNLYDIGCEVALAARWPGRVQPGRVVDDFVNLMDLAPTFLDAAGVDVPDSMSARSLLPVLDSERSGQVDPERSAVVTGRERHVATAREGNLPYPMRAIRTGDFLYIHNFEPDRWPAGNPRGLDDLHAEAPSYDQIWNDTRVAFADMDGGPTKAWLIHNRAREEGQPFFEIAFGKRPMEELYDLRVDPDYMNNVAQQPQYAQARDELSKKAHGRPAGERRPPHRRVSVPLRGAALCWPSGGLHPRVRDAGEATVTAPFRNPMFVPGNRPDMLQKATGLAPDAYVPDLEDSVPAHEKLNARAVTASFLPTLAEAGPLVLPRVNSAETGLMEEDLEAVVGPHIFGVSVGKVGRAADIDRISGILDDLEERAGLERGRTKLVPWIETAAAIVNAYEICAASPRVFAVAFGAEDFTRDMDIRRTAGDAEIAYPRSAVCIAARAAGVLAMDTPYFGFRDPEGLSEGVGRGPQLRIPRQVRHPSIADRHHPRGLLAQRRGEGARQAGGRGLRRCGAVGQGGNLSRRPADRRARRRAGPQSPGGGRLPGGTALTLEKRDKMLLEGMVFYGFHGMSPAEQELGQTVRRRPGDLPRPEEGRSLGRPRRHRQLHPHLPHGEGGDGGPKHPGAGERRRDDRPAGPGLLRRRRGQGPRQEARGGDEGEHPRLLGYGDLPGAAGDAALGEGQDEAKDRRGAARERLRGCQRKAGDAPQPHPEDRERRGAVPRHHRLSRLGGAPDRERHTGGAGHHLPR